MADVEIEDTFAEAFPMIAGRVLITAENDDWAMNSARSATGFASSIIMSPAEAGIEGPKASPKKTPDGRPGVYIQVYHRTGREFKMQILARIGQCILTCPTTAAFDAIPKAKKRIKLGRTIRYFGDGFQKKEQIAGRDIWRIPVMEGEFIIEDKFGVKRAVAGGNLLIIAKDQMIGLEAAEKAVHAIKGVEGVITPFPGGICRSGSKLGSLKYKLLASTNHPFCPILKDSIENSMLPSGTGAVYEIVINGLTLSLVKRAMKVGLKAAMDVEGVIKITAVNFGGKLGPFKINLKDLL